MPTAEPLGRPDRGLVLIYFLPTMIGLRKVMADSMLPRTHAAPRRRAYRPCQYPP